jgi:hypothetical protein
MFCAGVAPAAGQPFIRNGDGVFREGDGQNQKSA